MSLAIGRRVVNQLFGFSAFPHGWHGDATDENELPSRFPSVVLPCHPWGLKLRASVEPFAGHAPGVGDQFCVVGALQVLADQLDVHVARVAATDEAGQNLS